MAKQPKDYLDLLEGRGLLQAPKYLLELEDASVKELVDVMLAVFTGDEHKSELGKYSGRPQMVFYDKGTYDRVKTVLRKLGVPFGELPDGTADGHLNCDDINTTSPYPGNKGMKKPDIP